MDAHSVDNISRQSHGFAFVWFGSSEEPNGAVTDTNGKSWGGGKIQVKLARPDLASNPHFVHLLLYSSMKMMSDDAVNVEQDCFFEKSKGVLWFSFRLDPLPFSE